ncbi:NAD(P)H-dependent oxidoreductase [Aquimarina sp. U1-2]|uniref:NAD(P)H-dependent oxidoreductase n=1 Tax=Aquimarina sp. U1-2 TaxID=2823141 RepID=UPI001AECB045|nr:NAD(P)H-dependent oxidoreductase [Aquimarina sp. U1-2]MBP2831272.1 NAD(P)H-dependent oxidoreductase [Aquimarina sp. U1-2]
MKKILIVNGFQPNAFSEGKLNASLVEKAKQQFEANNFEVKTTIISEDYTIEEEVDKHIWADIIVLQTPVNWMGITWGYKKYIDEVFTAGMTGKLCLYDGRNEENPEINYGTGGSLNGSKYMLSLTFNAPNGAFNNEDEYLFQGKSVDDLFFPQHVNFRFLGMTALPTFVCYDVWKNPTIKNDFIRFEDHLNRHIINS